MTAKPGLVEPVNVVIVSPALADSNNGNWQTAKRWSELLAVYYTSRIAKHWPGELCGPAGANGEQILLALHARRSADSIHAWAAGKGFTQDCPGLVLALTGTDLYRDIHTHPEAMAGLRLAEQLIVLQSKAIEAVPVEFRHKVHVVYQSTDAMPEIVDKGQPLKVIMVGHLREEKMPETYMRAAQILKNESGLRMEHVGEALDEKYIAMIKQTTAICPNYQWLGGLGYEQSRKKMQEAHVLVHCSKMEGGAHVIMEAVRSGTPVLASRIDGNVGMLGEDYVGYFDLDDAEQLAGLILQLRNEQLNAGHDENPGTLNHTLREQSKRRAPLFAAEQERASLLNILGQCRK